MFKTALIALALTATTPALAQTNAAFVGPRVELNAGLDDVTQRPETNDVTYGAAVGIDAPVGDRFTLGVEGTVRNFAQDEGRTFGVAARAGVAATENVLVFGRAGYTNYEDAFEQKLDGLTVGGGLNFRLTPNTYANVEYRYSDFEHNVGSHGGLVGIGVRF